MTTSTRAVAAKPGAAWSVRPHVGSTVSQPIRTSKIVGPRHDGGHAICVVNRGRRRRVNYRRAEFHRFLAVIVWRVLRRGRLQLGAHRRADFQTANHECTESNGPRYNYDAFHSTL